MFSTSNVVDLVEGDDPSDAECPECGRQYDTTEWRPIQGDARIGIGHDRCPTEGCDGIVTKYF